MSVAFRRDCDEEHLEPRFELPIPPGPNLVTRRGYALIEARNAELEALLAAASQEDRRKELLRDLRYWRNRLATAQVIAMPKADKVGIGTRVTLEIGDQILMWRIVGHDESDAGSNRVAYSAPLARTLLGAEVGDEVVLPGSTTATVTRIDAED
ncbi:MAG: GreA/GreB family elongation factor [Allosphingosinicella sp.]